MELYHSKKIYHTFTNTISVANTSLQVILTFIIAPHSIGIVWQITSLVLAFLMADFINGLVHMYMDKTDNYQSIAGPLIANFHLHHKKPKYQQKPLYLVYFHENGSKIWLVVYLLFILLLTFKLQQHSFVLYTFFYIGIFSSLAEVSHYLCHNSNSKVVEFLASIGLLLSKEHHILHHRNDNTNYAFLNGASDPIINWIARQYSHGYKFHSDLHYKFYFPPIG